MNQKPGVAQDPQSGGVADKADALKVRVSPAVQVWLDLITDVIVEQVLKEQRTEQEITQKPIDAPGRVQTLPEKQLKASGPLRNDHGQKVVQPKGRLLTVQEAADYLGMSRASLAGRGWRIRNRLPAVKIGRTIRFDLQMLDRWIERHREHLPRMFAEEDV